MHIVAILNRDGGTLRTMDLERFAGQAVEIFSRQGHALDCEIVPGSAVQRALRDATHRPGVDAILAAGGDGTISTAATIALEAGVPLGVLPAGTMNLFARALKVPLDLTAALEALAAGQVGAVDVATANGQPFVHQFGVGVHARLVRIREGMSYNSRAGKMLASLRAIAAAAINPPQFEVELHTKRGTERRRVSGIAVSNNPLGNGQIHAERLDAGILGVYIAAPLATKDLVRLAIDVFLGTWRQSPAVSEEEVEDLTLSFPKRKRGAQAVVDGELIRLDEAVTIRILPGALKVLLPVTALAAARGEPKQGESVADD